jgi:predicted transcriptional regulator
MDWKAAGLPTEGPNAGEPNAGSVARRDAPTCTLEEELGEVRKRVVAGGWNTCVVVNSERVVLGILRAKELAKDSALPVEKAMRPGPSTYRPFVEIAEMAEQLVERDLPNVPITTSDGRLVGLLKREDALRAWHQSHSSRHGDNAMAG